MEDNPFLINLTSIYNSIDKIKSFLEKIKELKKVTSNKLSENSEFNSIMLSLISEIAQVKILQRINSTIIERQKGKYNELKEINEKVSVPILESKKEISQLNYEINKCINYKADIFSKISPDMALPMTDQSIENVSSEAILDGLKEELNMRKLLNEKLNAEMNKKQKRIETLEQIKQENENFNSTIKSFDKEFAPLKKMIGSDTKEFNHNLKEIAFLAKELYTLYFKLSLFIVPSYVSLSINGNYELAKQFHEELIRQKMKKQINENSKISLKSKKIKKKKHKKHSKQEEDEGDDSELISLDNSMKQSIHPLYLVLKINSLPENILDPIIKELLSNDFFPIVIYFEKIEVSDIIGVKVDSNKIIPNSQFLFDDLFFNYSKKIFCEHNKPNCHSYGFINELAGAIDQFHSSFMIKEKNNNDITMTSDLLIIKIYSRITNLILLDAELSFLLDPEKYGIILKNLVFQNKSFSNFPRTEIINLKFKIYSPQEEVKIIMVDQFQLSLKEIISKELNESINEKFLYIIEFKIKIKEGVYSCKIYVPNNYPEEHELFTVKGDSNEQNSEQSKNDVIEGITKMINEKIFLTKFRILELINSLLMFSNNN